MIAFQFGVKVKLIRFETKVDIDFSDYERVFDHENPVVARPEVFLESNEITLHG
jgi:hypothetical protein